VFAGHFYNRIEMINISSAKDAGEHSNKLRLHQIDQRCYTQDHFHLVLKII